MTPVSRLLLVVLDNLGDTVMATSVLRPLKRARPELRVGMFVKRYAADALADHSLIERVHAADPFWDRSPGQKSGGFGAFASTVFEIRRERYDAALILNTEWRRSLAIALAGVPRRIGYDRRHAGSFLTTAVPPSTQVQHFIDDHRRLVETLEPAAAGDDFVPRLEVPPMDIAWLDGWCSSAGWPGIGHVAIHPFSGDDRKNWPLESWRSLVDRLNRRPDERVVVLSSESERSRLADWMTQAKPNVRFLVGAPLRQVKAALSRASLLIGGDSGLGHVAAALGTPVLSLFGPGAPARSGPVGRGLIQVIQKDPLDTLSVDVVENSALDLLSRAETLRTL